MSAIAAPGARSRPAGAGLLVALLDGLAATLVLAAPTALARHSGAQAAAWFADQWLALLLPPPSLPLPSPLPLSLVVREREGGRRYPFHIPGYLGPRVVGERAHREVSGAGRVLLSSIPRRMRGAFAAPPGHRYLLVDIERCFAVLLATLAGDDALLAAAHGDLHQEAGDTIARDLPAAERRHVGKRFNNAVIGLITPAGWQRQLRELGIAATSAEARRMHDRWWARFARARAFRDAWLELHASAAAANRPVRIMYPDGRSYTFDAATVRGVSARPQWAHLVDPQARLAAAGRTTFSAIWRGVEGLVLDEALHRLVALQEHGLRLVLPLYDGLLLQAPEGSTEWLSARVREAIGGALGSVGVPATVSVTEAPTWAGRCAM